MLSLVFNSLSPILSNARTSFMEGELAWHKLLLVFTFLLAGLFLGLMVPILPWWFVLAFSLSPVILILFAANPFAGFIVTILLIFNVLPARFFPKIPMVGGGLNVYDVLLIYLILIVIWKLVENRISIRDLLGPIFVPYLYTMACIGVGLLYGKFVLHNAYAITEARDYIGWLVLPIAMVLVNSRQRYKYFLVFMIGVSVIISCYVIIQSALGVNIMGGRVEMLDSTINKDVIRSTAGGGVYIMIFTLCYAINLLRMRLMSLWLIVPLIMVIVTGLSVTFGRGVWVATGVAILLATYLHNGIKSSIYGLIVVALLVSTYLGVIAMAKPRYYEAVIERALGVKDEIVKGGSFGDRKIENNEALRSIKQNPFLGVGLGGGYMTIYAPIGTTALQPRYIHNSYLALPLKLGVHAALIPVIFIIGFTLAYRRWFLYLDLKSKVLPSAAAGGFISIFITSYTQPEWLTTQGISSISILIAIVLLYKKFNIGMEPSQHRRSPLS